MNPKLMLDVGQANELKLAFRREGDWDNEKIKMLTERRGLLTEVLAVLEGRAQIVSVDSAVVPVARVETFAIVVDHSQTLEQMIDAGRYDWKNDNITAKRFPIEGKGTVEFEAILFHFDKDISSEDAKKQIEKAGYEVGKIEHVLSFGANYPEEQRKFPIIGLGSVAKVYGGRSVPCLRGDGSRRFLGLGWFDDGWDAGCRFLAVRKKVTAT